MIEARQASAWSRTAPALFLMFLAPMVAEVLPGATRFSSIFVLPVEICVWGGGAVYIRYAVRRWQLGWRNMLLLALALSVAEECLIQQTSLAPLVIQLKGQVYARAFGVNYVYLLWALAYESIFVVFVPVYLAELIFRGRRRELWLGQAGRVVVAVFFLLGSFLAWFSWTQIARIKVFHLPPYSPPLAAVTISAAAIGLLLFGALGSPRRALARPVAPRPPPAPWVIGMGAGVWATLWFVLVLLAFGIAPQVSPALAVGGGLFLLAAILVFLPHWAAHSDWSDAHQFATVSGAIVGSMGLSFVGFIGSAPMDLYFKIGVDALAFLLLLKLRSRLQRA